MGKCRDDASWLVITVMRSYMIVEPCAWGVLTSSLLNMVVLPAVTKRETTKMS